MLLPYLKRFWLMLLSVVLVGAFGTGILIGLRNAYINMENGVDSFLEEYAYPDITVGVNQDVPMSWLIFLPKDYKEQMDIDQIIYRQTINTTFDDAAGKVFNGRVYSYENDYFIKQYLYDGYSSTDGLRMEYHFAKANGFKVGDRITIRMPQNKKVDYVINALICAPETSVVSQDSYSLSSARDFAYIYLPRAEIDKYYSAPVFTEVLVKFMEGKTKTLAEIRELYEKNKSQAGGIDFFSYISYASEYDTSAVIKQYDNTLRAINYISLGAPAIFFVIVLVVTALFLSQIIRQCRKDIGVMRALGEKKSSITGVFMLMTLATSTLSWLIGIGLGAAIILIANRAYGDAIRLYPLGFHINWIVVLIAFAALLIISELTAYFTCLGISRIKPVEAMKALPPANNKTPYLTRTLFKNTPIPFKVTVSQTIRNIKRYIVSGICIFASGVLIFVALSLIDSKQVMLQQLFDVRLNYDVQVYLNNMPDDPEAFINENFRDANGIMDPNIKDIAMIKYVALELKNGDKTEIGLINGIKNDQNLLNVVDYYHHTIDLPENGIVLAKHYANVLGAKNGDTIQINEIDTKVQAISDEYLYQVNYMEYDAFEDIIGKAKYIGSLVVRVDDTESFVKKYEDLQDLRYMSLNSTIRSEYGDRLMAFDISAGVLNAIAMIMGFLIVFNMIQTNLKEQKRSFATMRTLGYQRSSISFANLMNNLFQYVIALILAIPAGIGLSNFILINISSSDQKFPFPQTTFMYVMTCILVLVFLLASHYVAMNDMKRWNLPSAIKERE
jgi:putative ABC transport system permease protein